MAQDNLLFGERKSGYTSMYALPKIVGRDDIIRQALDALCAEKPTHRVVFFIGEGGIGKTRVLQELIERLNEQMGKGNVTDRVVDLYHTMSHTRNGLADALYEAAPFLMEDRIKTLRHQMTGLWVAGMAGQSAVLRKEHILLFEGVLRVASRKRPTFFALDTAERLIYESASVEADLPEHVADAWKWLLRLLEENHNLHLIIAGRPESIPLLNALRRQLGEEQVLRIDIRSLNEAGVLEYFQEMEKLARTHRDAALLRRLTVFTLEWRKRAAEWSQGIPIRLALMIDYLLMGGAAPDLSAHEHEDETWEYIFFKQLAEERTDAFDTLRAMGRLPKGANAELLAKVMGLEVEEARRRLQNIERFTFTKMLDVPGVGQRYFLHDELYRLLEKHYYATPWDYSARKEAQEKIRQYYEEQIENWRKKMQRTFRDVETGKSDSCPDSERLVQLYQQRHALLTEDVYYALRRDINRGFRRRYRYTRDADLSGDVALDYALQAELLHFFGEKDPTGKQERFNGVERKQLEGILAMRPVVRAWVEERYEDVLTKANTLRANQAFIAEDLNCAILDVWEAYARIMAAQDLEKARKRLDHAINETKAYEHKAINGDMTVWRGKAILAFASRVRGYLLDNLDELEAAIDDYRRAARLWREINLQMEVATTVNDLAFNLARVGQFSEARDLVLDALELLRKLGAPGQVGMSLNTLGLVYLEEGHYQDARTLSERALRLFECIKFKRGVGLASLALSEAIRRHAGASQLHTDEQRFGDLDQAEEYARKALAELEAIGDQWYLTRAYIEMGCVVRDKVRVCMSGKGVVGCDETVIKAYRKESEDLLNTAAKMAKDDGYENLQADALVNLGWLGYYAEDRALTERAEKQIRETFPRFYDGDQPAFPGETDVSAEQEALWEQMGKLYVVKGAWVYQDFEAHKSENRNKAEEALKEAGRLFTQALQYSTIRGNDYRNLRLGKRFIYDLLKALNSGELRAVCTGVVEAEQLFGWKSVSVMRQLMRDRALWYCEFVEEAES